MALLFVDGEVPPEAIPNIALAVVEHSPTLADASQEQCQYIFDKLIGALAARQIGRIVTKSAR